MELELKPGWLQRQFANVSRDVEKWPEWMRRAAGLPEREWRLLSADEARARAMREDEKRAAETPQSVAVRQAEDMRQAMERVPEILAAIEQNIIERNRSTADLTETGTVRRVRIGFGMDRESLAQCRTITGVLRGNGYECVCRLHPGRGWYDDAHRCPVEDEQILTVSW